LDAHQDTRDKVDLFIKTNGQVPTVLPNNITVIHSDSSSTTASASTSANGSPVIENSQRSELVASPISVSQPTIGAVTPVQMMPGSYPNVHLYSLGYQMPTVLPQYSSYLAYPSYPYPSYPHGYGNGYHWQQPSCYNGFGVSQPIYHQHESVEIAHRVETNDGRKREREASRTDAFSECRQNYSFRHHQHDDKRQRADYKTPSRR
jgi:hypothetical protein